MKTLPLLLFLFSIHLADAIVASHKICSITPANRLDDIESALLQQSDSLRRVVLLSVNLGFSDFAENWICSLRSLSPPITNYLFLAEDDRVYRIFNDKSYPVYYDSRLAPSGMDFSSAASYGQLRYQLIIHNRVKYVLEALKLGYNILLADVDAVWLENPFPYLDESHDIQGQQDSESFLCGGFIYLRNTTSSLALWSNVLLKHEVSLKSYMNASLYAATLPELTTEQNLINSVLRDMKRAGTVSARMLSIDKFPSGKDFFLQKSGQAVHSKPVTKPAVIHNNWIVGRNKKKKRFEDYDLWYLDHQNECIIRT